MCNERAWRRVRPAPYAPPMTEQNRLDEIERRIAAEEAEDAARPDDEHREPIRAYEGFAGTGVMPRGEDED